jgi:hypothetical protein
VHLRVDNRQSRYFLFLFLALAINAIDSLVVRLHRHPLVAVAATVDMVVVVTGIYYCLIVRPGIRKPWSLLLIALAGVLHATYLYPHAVTVRVAVAALMELGLIAFIALQLRRGRKGDPLDTIQSALPARLLATEFAILYYALCSWRAKPHVPPRAQGFTLHKRDGHHDLLFALALGGLLEILPVHLLIGHWSPLWAWIATGVSLYGSIWLAGLARSIQLRPTLVYADTLDLRYGLLFRARIPRDMILQVTVDPLTAAVVVPRKGEPNLFIELAAPVKPQRLLARSQPLTRIAIAADDPAALLRVLSGA